MPPRFFHHLYIYAAIMLTDALHFPMQYAKDEEPIVADSCIVALDMLEHEQRGACEPLSDVFSSM